MRCGLKLTHRRTPRARAAGRVERGVEDARRDRRVAAISFRSFARARGSSAAIERRTRVATVRLEIVMGRDDDFPGRVRDARARARDPTASSDALEALEVEAAIATIATAGGRGCGKTALTRRCFAEFRRRDDGNAGVAPREWRATPTIGMDFGAMTCECTGENGARTRVRARFLDPSGAREHAACRAEAYAAADAIVVVLDPARADASTESIETTLAEIANARETRGDEANASAAAASVRVVFARNLRAPPSRRISRALPRDDDVTTDELTARVFTAARAVLAREPASFRLLVPARASRRVSAAARPRVENAAAAAAAADALALVDVDLDETNASRSRDGAVANVDVTDGRGVRALFSAALLVAASSGHTY